MRLKPWIFMIPLLLIVAGCGSQQTSTQVEAGKIVYETYCAACHGIDGEGEPNWRMPDENGIYPAPPHDESGHTWHHADAVLLQVIRKGGGSPNSKMPAYADILSDKQMDDVLAYIRTFWGRDEQDFQRQMTEQWEEYNQ